MSVTLLSSVCRIKLSQYYYQTTYRSDARQLLK